MQESVYSPKPAQKNLPDDAPNILIVLIDDAGPGLPTTFDGEVTTKTMDRIVAEGISYNRFHTTAMCSPTRASMLTGRNHHRVASGQIAELANDWDGYSGHIPKSSALAAEVLKAYGYSTGAWGKWHNTPAEETTVAGPFENWPTNLGFEYFYGFLAGEASHYEPNLVRNTTSVLPPKSAEEGYHLSEDLADDAILCYEYNLFIIQRTKIRATQTLPIGKVKIEIETAYVVAKPGGPLKVTMKVNDTVFAEGTVPISAPLVFTANDCLDIGIALGSPVSLDYSDKAPFKFNGKIEQVHVKYVLAR